MAYMRPLEIILAKKTTDLVLLFHKNITKLVFLLPNKCKYVAKEKFTLRKNILRQLFSYVYTAFLHFPFKIRTKSSNSLHPII